MSRPHQGHVRSFDRQDIPAVCRLFAATFRRRVVRRQQELAGSLEATYLTAPGYSQDGGSIVHVDDQGAVDGFMGIINITMQAGGRTLRAGVLGAYMADPAQANPLIGVCLIRATVTRGLDIVFTNTANRTSADIARPMGFHTLPLQSLEWTKILRPAGAGAYMLCRGARFGERWLARPTQALDAILPHRGLTGINTRSTRGAQDRPLTLAEFAAAAPPFLDGYALRPAWDAAELSWLLTQAALQQRHGPLIAREVIDRGGLRVGAYLLYARRLGVAHALQVLALPGRGDAVVASLLQHAAGLGAVAVRGAGTRESVSGLTRQTGVIYRSSMAAVLWTGDASAAQATLDGNVFVGGLAGETWARIFADTFN